MSAACSRSWTPGTGSSSSSSRTRAGSCDLGRTGARPTADAAPAGGEGASVAMTSTEQPVPRWADRAAHLTALTTLPSGLWRIPLALGFSMGMTEEHAAVYVGGWESVYVLSLSVVAESAALLTLGLVRPWGERVPSWLPRI